MSAEARARPGELSLKSHVSARLGLGAAPRAPSPHQRAGRYASAAAPIKLKIKTVVCRSSGARATPRGGAAGERQGACVRLVPNARLGATWAALASKHIPRRALGARRGEQGPPQPRHPRSRFVMARGRAPPSFAAPGCPAPPAPPPHERRRDGGRGKTPRFGGAVRGGWTAQGFLVCRCARTRGPRLRLSPPRPCTRPRTWEPPRQESLASTGGGGGREEGTADFAGRERVGEKWSKLNVFTKEVFFGTGARPKNRRGRLTA